LPVNPRFIPVLLLRGTGLVKTERFADGRYLGDAINAVSIFNDKRVDELIVLDIDCPRESRTPRLGFIRDLASECFIPLTYGGGVRELRDVGSVLEAGVEKVAINTGFFHNPALVTEAAKRFGSQSIVVAIDVRRDPEGVAQVCVSAGRQMTNSDPVAYARRAADAGAGELLVQSVDRDGTWSGYDTDLIRSITAAVDISVVALGGARNLADLAGAIVQGGASAAAAGSMFVFYGRLNAVLINVPDEPARIAALEAARRT
jgi:cyclase